MMSSKKRRSQSIDWVTVGKRVKDLRTPLTQAKFAAKIRVSQGYLSAIERGQKEIGPEVLLRISEECSKSIDWLLTGRN